MLKTVVSGKLKGTRKVCQVILVLIGLAVLFSAPVNASYMYDQEEVTSQLIVDKQLKAVDLDDWQDNIPASQLVLEEGDMLEFRIKIKNSGDKELKNINAHDFLPAHLELVFHPGTFDKDNNQVNWEIDQLDPGEEREFKFRTHVQKSDQEVVDGTLCLINKADAKAESGEYDQDTASFCIVAPTKLPKAGSGFDHLAMGTGIAGMFALAGLVLRLFGRGGFLA
jgi:uncharacterized repeat protein (TIGR01451 family)